MFIKNKQICKRIVPVVILAFSIIISIIANSQTAKGSYSVVDNSRSDYSVDDLVVEMENGTITIVATSTTAVSTIRYKTIGFGIGLSRQNNKITVKDLNNKDWTGPAAPAYQKDCVISLDDMHKTEIRTNNGKTITTFVFPSKEVSEKLAEYINMDLEQISNHTKLYLNAQFQTYENNEIRHNHITSWEEIMTAEAWRDEVLSDFSKYYNMELGFAPGPQPNDLYYKCGDNTLKHADLKEYCINDYVHFQDKVREFYIDQDGTTYKLKGYEIKYKVGGKTAGKEENASLEDILWVGDAKYKNEEIREPYGGLNIYLKFEKVSDAVNPNTLYYEFDGSKVKAAELAKRKTGETLTWKKEANENPPKEILKKKEDYELLGYRLETKNKQINLFDENTNRIIRYKVTDQTLSDEKIIGGSAKVVEGGLDITLIYGKPGDIPLPPTPIPKPGSPTPKPEAPDYDIPEGGEEYKNLDSFETYGRIRADLRDAERFDVLQGIPTTESLYTQARGTDYNLGYSFHKKVVEKVYPIRVSKKYILSWTDAKDKKKVMEEEQVVTQTINVKRTCAYWEVNNFDYYILDHAVIYNKALPDGKCIMYPNTQIYDPPKLILKHDSGENYHIKPPKEAEEGIILPSETLTGSGSKPFIRNEDFTYEANTMTGEMQVRNDYLSFDGSIVMNSNYYQKETPDLTNLSILNQERKLCNRDVLYQPNQIIKAELFNDIYQSTGTLTYKNHPMAVNPVSNHTDLQLNGLNSVTVHTPVICDACITSINTTTKITNNDPYVQTLKVNKGCVQLVLDPDDKLSDFTVDINNYGKHLSIPGYFTRDFAWGLRNPEVSYIARKNDIYRNEVKFPFDVFYRNPSGKDEYIKKNTWMRFGHSTPTFYLPMWVDEGIYTVNFRTIAVNGVNEESQLNKTQIHANTDLTNYVATDTVKVQVSGRIYGLTLYDVSDYPTWETIFRTAEGSAGLKLNEGYPSGIKRDKYHAGYAYDYTVGTSDQYGKPTGRLERFTLPLVNGSHPKLENIGILKTGYAVKFKVTTTGNMFSAGDRVVIQPRFYYVDREGKNRREVDVYYSEYFGGKSHSLVKVGSSLDKTNQKSYRCGNQYLGIPEVELKRMADIYKCSLDRYKYKKADLFTYSKIQMQAPLMTYTNTDYLRKIKSGDQYEKIKEAGITDSDMVNRMQTFYGEYFLTADVRAVEKGFDVYGYAARHGVGEKEAFWLKDGYLIVNFELITVDADGNKNLSYLNLSNTVDGYCSMWKMENYDESKVSNNGFRKKSTLFQFQPGDFMIYDMDKSIRNDYETYIIN